MPTKIKTDEKTVPTHYNSTEFTPIEVIKDWKLGFSVGNALKYIGRAGKKPGESELDDLRKAAWYLNDRIEELEAANV